MSYTVVFDGSPKNIAGNPFDVQTPWGKPISIGYGDAHEREDLLRNALEQIREDGDTHSAEVAADALDKNDELMVSHDSR